MSLRASRRVAFIDPKQGKPPHPPVTPDDPNLYEIAVSIVLSHSRTPTLHEAGYNRSAALLEHMQEEGIVGEIEDDNRRPVLAQRQ